MSKPRSTVKKQIWRAVTKLPASVGTASEFCDLVVYNSDREGADNDGCIRIDLSYDFQIPRIREFMKLFRVALGNLGAANSLANLVEAFDFVANTSLIKLVPRLKFYYGTVSDRPWIWCALEDNEPLVGCFYNIQMNLVANQWFSLMFLLHGADFSFTGETLRCFPRTAFRPFGEIELAFVYILLVHGDYAEGLTSKIPVCFYPVSGMLFDFVYWKGLPAFPWDEEEYLYATVGDPHDVFLLVGALNSRIVASHLDMAVMSKDSKCVAEIILGKLSIEYFKKFTHACDFEALSNSLFLMEKSLA